jgi:hypothetical protein
MMEIKHTQKWQQLAKSISNEEMGGGVTLWGSCLVEVDVELDGRWCSFCFNNYLPRPTLTNKQEQKGSKDMKHVKHETQGP